MAERIGQYYFEVLKGQFVNRGKMFELDSCDRERFSWKRGLFIAGVYTASFDLGTSALLVSRYVLEDSSASLEQFTKNSVSMLSALITGSAVVIASARHIRGETT